MAVNHLLWASNRNRKTGEMMGDALLLGLGAVVLGTIFSILGGAAGGVFIGGKALGNELAAMMGGFYGPLAGAVGVFVGTVIALLVF